MGSACSKTEKNEALRLCKDRKRLIKQAIDSRYGLAAAHVAYTQSLRDIGISLRRYAESEVLVESSLSTSITDHDKSPSHCSYPSLSPSHNVDNSDSPLHNESPILPHPVSSRMSFMRSAVSAPVTFRFNSLSTGFDDHENMSFSMPPPPPPPHESGSSWDYFDTSDDIESFRNVGHNGFNENSEPRVVSVKAHSEHKSAEISGGSASESAIRADTGALVVKAAVDDSLSKTELGAEREDPSDFITHRAKDFLSSVKDIEHRFFRASEAGKEVARLLEANKIRVGYSQGKGSSRSSISAALHLVCCTGNNAVVFNEPPQNVTKVITWNRSTSSHSSSSKNPLVPTSKDDNDDSGSDFMEEFSMIAGSHSSTLDRLYAWERKLYDEVKASEILRKEYDQKCHQLRHQFAKDLSTRVIDKTRAVVKDLHSRIRVGLHSVDLISKRIEKMRDEELQPQLVELIQGLTRMWKAMLECHHAQYITISLAYHTKSSSGTHQKDSQKQIITQLHHEIECFQFSFTDWVKSHTLYIEALNGWLQNCILQPRERTKSRRPFSPRRVIAPPIFVLCRDWSAGIKGLPSDELSTAIKSLLIDLCQLMSQQEKRSEEIASKDDDEEGDDHSTLSLSSLSCIQASLTKMLDRLTKYSEASLKMYEDVRQKSEAARIAYTNCKPRF